MIRQGVIFQPLRTELIREGKNFDGIITSWNRAAERRFGFTAAEAIGQSIRIIVPADRQDEENSFDLILTLTGSSRRHWPADT